jgi:GH24 family phage-related lysozyme (muramidase)
MSPRIRVDTEKMRKAAAEIEKLGGEIRKTGAKTHDQTVGLKDYGGQLPIKKNAYASVSTANARQADMADDAQRLRTLADLFDKADRDTTQSFEHPEVSPPLKGEFPFPPLDLPSMHASKCGINFIAFFEDIDKPFYPLYNDAAGNCTVGIGHLVHMGPCTSADSSAWGKGLPKDKAQALLAQDAQKAEDIVKNAVTVPLTQAQFDALVSLAYNLGRIPKELLDVLNAGDYDAAAQMFNNYCHGSNGVVYAGLVKRRKAESDLFTNGVYGNEECNSGAGSEGSGGSDSGGSGSGGSGSGGSGSGGSDSGGSGSGGSGSGGSGSGGSGSGGSGSDGSGSGPTAPDGTPLPPNAHRLPDDFMKHDPIEEWEKHHQTRKDTPNRDKNPNIVDKGKKSGTDRGQSKPQGDSIRSRKE